MPNNEENSVTPHNQNLPWQAKSWQPPQSGLAQTSFDDENEKDRPPNSISQIEDQMRKALCEIGQKPQNLGYGIGNAIREYGLKALKWWMTLIPTGSQEYETDEAPKTRKQEFDIFFEKYRHKIKINPSPNESQSNKTMSDFKKSCQKAIFEGHEYLLRYTLENINVININLIENIDHNVNGSYNQNTKELNFNIKGYKKHDSSPVLSKVLIHEMTHFRQFMTQSVLEPKYAKRCLNTLDEILDKISDCILLPENPELKEFEEELLKKYQHRLQDQELFNPKDFIILNLDPRLYIKSKEIENLINKKTMISEHIESISPEIMHLEIKISSKDPDHDLEELQQQVTEKRIVRDQYIKELAGIDNKIQEQYILAKRNTPLNKILTMETMEGTFIITGYINEDGDMKSQRLLSLSEKDEQLLKIYFQIKYVKNLFNITIGAIEDLPETTESLNQANKIISLLEAETYLLTALPEAIIDSQCLKPKPRSSLTDNQLDVLSIDGFSRPDIPSSIAKRTKTYDEKEEEKFRKLQEKDPIQL